MYNAYNSKCRCISEKAFPCTNLIQKVKLNLVSDLLLLPICNGVGRISSSCACACINPEWTGIFQARDLLTKNFVLRGFFVKESDRALRFPNVSQATSRVHES